MWRIVTKEIVDGGAEVPGWGGDGALGVKYSMMNQ